MHKAINLVYSILIKSDTSINDWANSNPVIFGLIITLAIIIAILLLSLVIIKIKTRDKNKKKDQYKAANLNKKFGFKKGKDKSIDYGIKKSFDELEVGLHSKINLNSNLLDSDLKDINLLDEEEIKALKLRMIKELKDATENNLQLLSAKKKYEQYSEKLNEIIDLENQKLSEISKLSISEAKTMLLGNVYKRMRKDINDFYKEENARFNEKAKIKAREILVYAMEGMAEDIVSQRSIATIPIADEALKGRIIGKHGRNKKLFESLTGVDMIIEKNTEITLSSVNPIRREIAINLFNAMMRSKNIEPSKIETLYQAVKDNFEKIVIEHGREAIEDNLKVYDINPEIYGIVGRLKFRTSYGQNVLQHCLECASYAAVIATYLGINPEKAKLAAFFHDIGKAVDFEEDYDHVESGLEIAKKYDLPDYICNAIESHHNKIEPSTIYGALVKVVDTLSAARPGARVDSFHEYIKRVERLENICKKINGVEEAYALQSGRVVRIMVKPEIIKDEELDLLNYEIQKAIENDELTNKHQIKVIMIREKRIEFLVNSKKDNNIFSINQFYSKNIIEEDGNI